MTQSEKGEKCFVSRGEFLTDYELCEGKND